MSTVRKFELESAANISMEGDLKSIDLASLFQVLKGNGRDGTLEIDAGPDLGKRFLYFSGPGTVFVRPAAELGEFLLGRCLRRGLISSEQFAFLENEADVTNRNRVQILLEADFVEPAAVSEILGEVIQETIYDLFFLRDASFRFYPQTLALEEYWDSLPLNPTFLEVDRIVIEAARRIDEWGVLTSRIPSLTDVYRTTRAVLGPADLPSAGDVRLVYSLIDGERDVSELIRRSFFTKFEVSRALVTLLDDGFIQLLSAADLEKKADKFLRSNRLRDGIRFLLRALDQEKPTPNLHLKLAQAFEQSKDTARAAYHYRETGDLLRAEGRIEEAFRSFTQAVRLAPSDRDARERRLELYVAHRRRYRLDRSGIAADATAVVGRYASSDPDRAVDILRRLCLAEGDDVPHRSQVIELFLTVGRTDEAIHEYEQLAAFLLARDRLVEARGILKKILALDRGRADIAARLREIEAEEQKRTGRRRRLRSVATLFVPLILVGAVYERYDRAARLRLDSLLERATDDDDVRVIEELREFPTHYPFSLVSFRVPDEIRLLMANREAVQKKRADEDRMHQAFAEDCYRNARDWVDKDHLDLAILALEKAIDVSPRKDWVHKEGLDAKLDGLRRYLDESDSIHAQALAAHERGDVKAEHDALQLLWRRYSKSPYGNVQNYPVRVESRPPGALISVNGKPTGEMTPATVRIDPRDKNVVELSRAGYISASDEADLESSWPLVIELVKKPAWRTETRGAIGAAAVVRNGVAFVGSRDAHVYAVDVRTSRVVWKRRLSLVGEVEAEMALCDDRVVAGSNDRSLYALRASDGEILWNFPLDAFVQGAPLAVGKHVFACSAAGTLYAIDADSGREIFHRSMGVPLVCSPVVAGDRIAIATADGRVFIVSAADGSLSKELPTGDACTAQPLFVNSLIVVATRNGLLQAVDASTGRTTWRFQADGAVTGSPLVLGSTLLFGTESGALYEIGAADGRQFQTLRLGTAIRSTPLVDGAVAYVGADDGYLYAIGMRPLAVEWRARTGGPIRGGVTLVDGRLLVGSADRGLYAFLP
ncbi:MAG: PQQ-binding-like beta-propeller repeat protein [Planctomycetes bacterium]|nr:PQQ-binding-like beta-propeller repeat protein [Planctomycetota bacterium]